MNPPRHPAEDAIDFYIAVYLQAVEELGPDCFAPAPRHARASETGPHPASLAASGEAVKAEAA